MFDFILKGDPIAMQRPRFSKNKVYNPQSELKKKTQLIIKTQMASQGILNALEGPIFVFSTFYTAIPNSFSEKKKKAILGKPCIKKPDIDNYTKFYLDAMNEIVYKDDAQVAFIFCKKIYALEPRTEITIIGR